MFGVRITSVSLLRGRLRYAHITFNAKYGPLGENGNPFSFSSRCPHFASKVVWAPSRKSAIWPQSLIVLDFIHRPLSKLSVPRRRFLLNRPGIAMLAKVAWIWGAIYAHSDQMKGGISAPQSKIRYLTHSLIVMDFIHRPLPKLLVPRR